MGDEDVNCYGFETVYISAGCENWGKFLMEM